MGLDYLLLSFVTPYDVVELLELVLLLLLAFFGQHQLRLLAVVGQLVELFHARQDPVEVVRGGF